MDLGLHDSIILITGGGAGIGQAITRACLEEGATVVVVSRTSDNVKTFLAEMHAAQRPCDFVETDLADFAQCRRAIDYVRDKYGRLHGLVNTAGPNDAIGLESGSPQRFLESLHQNLVHYYALAHYAMPMLKAARGSILNISSEIALTGQGGTSAYAAAKGAQLALTREWAAELAPFGVRANAIPLGHRLTEAAEIAAVAVFLLSPTQSAHTTGQHIISDGGYTRLDRALT
jgi:L-fucose dehydrogenase